MGTQPHNLVRSASNRHPDTDAAASSGGAGAISWSAVLRALREARGVTQDGWGARLAVSRATVQRWERGERPPDPEAEAAILAYCREAGLLRAYDHGPLAGFNLTAESLQHLLVQARLGGRAGANPAATPKPAPAHAAAPPPDAEPPPVSNLPVYLTRFVGRERELAEVRRVQSGTRLLTLTGAGGSGKTRLAHALAGELLWAYPHGVWWADLTPLADAALLAQTVAAALAVPVSGQRDPLDSLIESVRGRHLLLVLDNCEHLLPACAALTETLLRALPDLELIATSRESLGINGETVWRAPPLSLPDTSGLTGSDAARLFIERARLQRPELTISTSDEAAIADICRQLDGMPLALELAAARVNALSIGQIAARLHDRFQLLTGGGRTALARHQTLRAAMDWSYDLLTPAEQTLLRALSVFAGGFTLEAAEAVCGREGDGLEPADVLDLLARLVDKSLVVADTRGGTVRYRLLETVRQYAAERPRAAGEAAAVQDRHALWCLALAETAFPHRGGTGQEAWLARLAIEHDNLRAALRWYQATPGQGEQGLTLAGLLYWFWQVRGHLSEGRQWLAAMLERGGHAPPLLRARALDGAGQLAMDQGEMALAAALIEQGLALRREIADEPGIAASLNNLATVIGAGGDPARARVLLEEALAVARRLNDPMRIGAALNNLGITARQLGELDQAAVWYDESLRLARESGDTRLMSYALLNLAHVHHDAGATELAAARYRDSIALCRDIADPQGAARCLQGLARLSVAGGDMARGARLCGAAAALRAAAGVQQPAGGRAVFEETVQRARAALGEEAFTAAWQTGQAFSLEDATREALAGIDDDRPAGLPLP